MKTNKLKVYRLKLKTPKYPAGLYLYLVIGEDKKVYANSSRLINPPPVAASTMGIPASKVITDEDEIEEAMIGRLKRFCPEIENDVSIDISIGELANLISSEDIAKLMFSLNGMAQV
jgi:hypothetical protein